MRGRFKRHGTGGWATTIGSRTIKNPRFRTKHFRAHRNAYGLYPQQQQKIERQTLKKMTGI